ncbi:hypothetical protein [Litoreibacter halocynthiae]|uniref:hypothetical protein n=1 Tax=Litoreibacter halocynthiae TaxID=1242689 RepID=UPI002491E8E4|nr:hypothetical protein [Litoreibacter halocynthiae]
MGNLVLWVGNYKTGTSYQQALFHKNRHFLSRNGLLYPDFKVNRGQHLLSGQWTTLKTGGEDAIARSGGAHALFNLHLKKARKFRGTTLWHAESFMKVVTDPVKLQDLKGQLDGFDGIKVLFTVRAADRLRQSLIVQTPGTSSAEDVAIHLNGNNKNGRFHGSLCAFEAISERLAETFGRNAVRILSYEQLRKHPRGFAAATLEAVDVRLLDLLPRMELPAPDESNISASPLAVFLSRQVATDERLARSLAYHLDADPRIFGGKPTSVFTKAQYSKVRDRYLAERDSFLTHVRKYEPGFEYDLPAWSDDTVFLDEIDFDLLRPRAEKIKDDLAQARVEIPPLGRRIANRLTRSMTKTRRFLRR